jgi:AraC family transcriptional activator of pobA
MTITFKQKAMETTIKTPVFPNDVSFFFNISTVESLIARRAREKEALREPHYQIICITRGSGTVEIDLERLSIEANTIYTIPPGRFYQFDPAEPLAGYVLSFNVDFLYLAIEGPGRPFFKEIDTELKRVGRYSWDPRDPNLQNVLADIRREFDAHLILRLEILTGLLKIFLIYMKRQAVICYREDGECEDTRIFNRFYSQLDDQFIRMRKVADYARALYVTPGHLNNVIKRVTGHSASYHIRQRTIQEAKRMIIYNEANLKTVAHSLGFDDMAHFSKYFKNAIGMTFSEFRKTRSTRHGA